MQKGRVGIRGEPMTKMCLGRGTEWELPKAMVCLDEQSYRKSFAPGRLLLTILPRAPCPVPFGIPEGLATAVLLVVPQGSFHLDILESSGR